MKKSKVVVIGGGTGTYNLLRGLKKYQEQLSITAVVTMADSGGSTGRLRDEFGFLPVGDARMALTALAGEDDKHEELLRKLFLYRFEKGDGLCGHNFGNLLLVALTDILGSEEQAIRSAGRVLRVEGRVVPITTKPVHLVATYADGVVIEGEHEIDEPKADRFSEWIVKLTTKPTASLSESAQIALSEADLIVLGPGDLYTSLLANLVIEGVPQALQQSSAKLVFVTNLMTRRGQTHDFGVQELTQEIERYAQRKLDCILVNNAPLPIDLLERYEELDEYPVKFNFDPEDQRLILTDLLASEVVQVGSSDSLRRSLIRHDSTKLANQITKLLLVFQK
jgi:uncharacterized cofD-like protein